MFLPEKKVRCNLEENNGRKTFWQKTLQNAALLLEQSLALSQEVGFAIKDFIEGAPQGAKKVTDIPLKIACCAGKIIALIIRAFPESYAPVQADAECTHCLAEGSRKAPSQ
jgi:hypothetical protein